MKTIAEEATSVLLQARIPEMLARRVRVLAAGKGCPPRDVVVEALEQYLPDAERLAQQEFNPDPGRTAIPAGT